MKLTADRLDRISPSLTIAMTTKARALKASGKDVIGLSSGEPDFDTPQNVKDAAIAAIQRGETKYTDADGMPELKAARRSAKFASAKTTASTYDSRRRSTIASGGKPVIYNALVATINRAATRSIVPAPYWVSAIPTWCELGGGEPVEVVGQ